MLLTTVHSDRVLIPVWMRRGSKYPHWLCRRVVKRRKTNELGSSLYCRDLRLEADECSVSPVTEELEVLKELMAGLQDIKLIWEVRGEGGGHLSQPWCFNSQHL